MEQRVLTKTEFRTMKTIFSMRQSSLCKALYQILKSYYPKDKLHGTSKYIYAEGDIPVGLVAHMDTVHTQCVSNLFHDSKKGVLWSPEGLGADDRAGIYAILEILSQGYRPSVIFCADEEIGGVGAEALVKAFPTFKSPIGFLIELDRRGSDDCVFYECDNGAFEDYINQFGFITEIGSFSDISVIAPEWKIAAVNLSIGYYYEHSYRELLLYRQMFNTIDRVMSILDDAAAKALSDTDYLSYEYIPCTNYYKYYPYTNTYNGVSVLESSITPEKRDYDVCSGCNLVTKKEFMIPVEEEGSKYYFCPQCAQEFVRWCDECGKPYIGLASEEKKISLCAKCKEDKLK